MARGEPAVEVPAGDARAGARLFKANCAQSALPATLASTRLVRSDLKNWRPDDWFQTTVLNIGFQIRCENQGKYAFMIFFFVEHPAIDVDVLKAKFG